jgi:hypothetical protein
MSDNSSAYLVYNNRSLSLSASPEGVCVGDEATVLVNLKERTCKLINREPHEVHVTVREDGRIIDFHADSRFHGMVHVFTAVKVPLLG